MFSKKPEPKKVHQNYVPKFTIEWCEDGYKGYVKRSYFDSYYTPLHDTKENVVQHIYKEACEQHIKDMMNNIEGYSYG